MRLVHVIRFGLAVLAALCLNMAMNTATYAWSGCNGRTVAIGLDAAKALDTNENKGEDQFFSEAGGSLVSGQTTEILQSRSPIAPNYIRFGNEWEYRPLYLNLSDYHCLADGARLDLLIYFRELDGNDSDYLGGMFVSAQNHNGILSYEWHPLRNTIMNRYDRDDAAVDKITDDTGASFDTYGANAHYHLNISAWSPD